MENERDYFEEGTDIDERMEQISIELELGKREADLISKLDGYDVVRMIDRSPEEQEKQWVRHSEQWYDRPDLDQWSESSKAIECLLTYKSEIIFQSQLVRTVAALQMFANHPENGITPGELSNMKKQFQAELMVHHGVGLDKPWQLFVANETPDIEGLSLDRDEDLIYIQEAEGTLNEFWQEKDRKSAEIWLAVDLIGADIMEREQTTFMASFISGMQEISESYPSSARLDRFRALYQFGAHHNIADTYGKPTLNALVEYFDDRY